MAESIRSSASWRKSTKGNFKGADLAAEPAPMTFPLSSGGEELRVSALVYVPDLIGKVIQLLEQNMERYMYMYVTIVAITESAQLRHAF